MALLPGTRIGAYEIVGPIGAGGMGEVYRARDPRLDRDVAIKILPERSSSNRSAVARLQIEARAASSLNHPNILTVHEIGHIDGDPPRDYIVTEFIEGVTLREYLANRPELEDLLELLIQIGDGLAKAHEAHIVHRDLKPENIMVTTDGYAKILDFGLAKVVRAPVDTEAQTEVAPLSVAGALLGTIGYLAPEQIGNAHVDARADIFSFGCIAYEAIAGRRAFAGRTQSETLQLILTADPRPLRASNPRVPPELQKIVSRCMAKDVAQRHASMKDVVAALRRAHDRIRNGAARSMPRLSQLTFDRAVEQYPAISPDATRVLFSREVGHVRKLFLTAVGSGTEEPITSGEHADIQATWSPSGDAILFVRAREAGTRVELSDVFGRVFGGDVWMLDLPTRKETLLIRDAANPAWSPDGKHIAFDASWSGPHRIWIADARGRNPLQVTTDSSDAIHHLRPRWAPDGQQLVFQKLEGPKFNIAVASLTTKDNRTVTDDYTMDVHPVWSPDGEWIYFSSYRSGGINVWRIPVDVDGTPSGTMEQVTSGPGHDVDLDMRTPGRIVLAIMKQNADIWRLPVDPGTGEATGRAEPVIEATRENSRGAWSPDGSSIAFSSDRAGDMNLWLYGERDGKIRQLTRGAGGDFQPNWSPDCRSLVYFSGRSGTLDIWRVDVEGEGEPVRLTQGEGLSINPFFSPDGRRIAFMSDRDGRLEVWVMNADGSDPRQLTSVGVGGHFLRWSADGTRIYFRSPTGPKARTMVVPADGGDAEATAEVIGGAHMSLSPDQSMIMDVVAHKTLWVSPLAGGEPRRVFEFEDADSRIIRCGRRTAAGSCSTASSRAAATSGWSNSMSAAHRIAVHPSATCRAKANALENPGETAFSTCSERSASSTTKSITSSRLSMSNSCARRRCPTFR